jgi:uncharacterized protein YjbI with pentapeptide repeats
MASMTRLRALIVIAIRPFVEYKTVRVTIALWLAVTVAVAYGSWFDWEWKAMIGWKALVDYINPDPDDTTGKKDAIQVYAVIVAGGIASITAAVGLANLRLTRKNLEQQRELETQRAQGTALQTYYEQIGKLLTEYDLRNTKRKEIRELARGQTLTVLQEVDGNGKGSLLTFLQGAGLIGTENPAVALTEAHLQGVTLLRADLPGANLQGANLQEASLQDADLYGANLQDAWLYGANLQGANLQEANLQGASLYRANLQEANLQGAKVTDNLLADTQSLRGATMPDGQKYKDWLKDKEGSGKDVENE